MNFKINRPVNVNRFVRMLGDAWDDPIPVFEDDMYWDAKLSTYLYPGMDVANKHEDNQTMIEIEFEWPTVPKCGCNFWTRMCNPLPLGCGICPNCGYSLISHGDIVEAK